MKKIIKLLILFASAFVILAVLSSCDTCQHEYDTSSVVADCEHETISRQACLKCGEMHDVVISPSGHSFKESVVLPTCSTEGYTLYTCDCGFSYKGSFISANGHDYRDIVVDPTCTEGGYTLFVCNVCNDAYKDKTLSASGHDLECKKIDPTCEDQGYAEYTCKNCDHSFLSDYCKPTGHSFTTSVTLPDCNNSGYTTYTCSDCSYSFVSDFVDPAPHSFTSETVAQADCEVAGEVKYTCDCGYSYSVITPPVGHSFTAETVSEADCETEGEIKYSCDCGYSYSAITPPKGHNFSHKNVAPTVSDMGYTEFTCECGFNYIGNYRFYSEILDNAYAGNDQVVAHGIDISKWNHTVNAQGEFEPLDWMALKEAGVDYVILKIGSTPREDGTLGGVEPTFEMDYAGAKAAGIDVGVYYFTYAESVSEIRKDAEYILGLLEGKQFEYPIYLDLENSPNEGYMPSEIAAPILTEMCLSFFSELQKNGYYTGLYVNNEFLFNILQTENMIELFEIWYARYPSVDPYVWNPEDSESFVWNADKYGAHLGMWQYSMTGSLAPITTEVDFNYSYKDYPTLIKTHGFNGLTPDDVPDDLPEEDESDETSEEVAEESEVAETE